VHASVRRNNVVFAGFSAEALAERMDRAGSELLVTCDGYYRRGNAVHQKNKADNARIMASQEVRDIVVVDRPGDEEVHLGDGYHDYDELVADHHGAEIEPVTREADDELFVIYTSGTTASPSGIRHTTGGYLAHAAWTSHAVPRPETRRHLLVFGRHQLDHGPHLPRLRAARPRDDHHAVRGRPDHPEKDRVWELIERNAVDVFYTAPTAIRAFIKWGPTTPTLTTCPRFACSGTVGEPINADAWWWYYEHVGNGECPIVDTWWQTETGSILVSTVPGVDEMKPGSAGPPLPGIDATVVDETGAPVAPETGGYLTVTKPWPGMPLDLPADGAPDVTKTGGTSRRTRRASTTTAT